MNNIEYPAALVANTFLSFYFHNNQITTNLEIQKMLYIAHGHHLGIKGVKLIKEDFEAWTYGPVIRSLYDKLKHYRHKSIQYYISEISKSPDFIEEKEDIWSFLLFVYNAYKFYRPMDLVYLTHGRDGAWAKTFSSDKKIIDTDLIIEEYKNKELSIQTEEAEKLWETAAKVN